MVAINIKSLCTTYKFSLFFAGNVINSCCGGRGRGVWTDGKSTIASGCRSEYTRGWHCWISIAIGSMLIGFGGDEHVIIVFVDACLDVNMEFGYQ